MCYDAYRASENGRGAEASVDQSYSAYTEAALARTKAEEAEGAAETRLNAALRAVEQQGQAGPSGVKAESSDPANVASNNALAGPTRVS